MKPKNNKRLIPANKVRNMTVDRNQDQGLEVFKKRGHVKGSIKNFRSRNSLQYRHLMASSWISSAQKGHFFIIGSYVLLSLGVKQILNSHVDRI